MISQKSARNHIVIYGNCNYTRNVLLAEDKKKYNAQNKGIFAKKFVYTNHRWFWGGQMVLGRSLRVNTSLSRKISLVEEEEEKSQKSDYYSLVLYIYYSTILLYILLYILFN